MGQPVRYYLLLLILFLSASCTRKHHDVARAFYYWKTVYKPTPYELQRLQQMDVHKMYVRLFDVDEDPVLKKPMPVAPVRMGSKDSGLAYVPVVFITQRALIALNDSSVQKLAENICAFAQTLCEQASITPAELQIDCDWTSGTKDKYFSLLKILKAQPYMKGKLLSCTIRLNQVKYTVHNGIPPVDRGLVMCYGMGSLKRAGALNSILDVSNAKDYLKYMHTYPLALDMALPAFEWCVLFRGQQYRGILHDVTTGEIKDNALFKLKETNLYTCLRDTVWQGYHLKANDIVRTENTEYADILNIANYAAQRINNKDMSVIFFACDSITLSKFSNNEIETIYNSYR